MDIQEIRREILGRISLLNKSQGTLTDDDILELDCLKFLYRISENVKTMKELSYRCYGKL